MGSLTLENEGSQTRKSQKGTFKGLAFAILCLIAVVHCVDYLKSDWKWTYDIRNPLQVLDDLRPEYAGKVRWWKCTEENDAPGSECGYIITPLDYLNASAGTARIALGRYPATKSPKKGAVLFNFGGPGGPGKPLITALGAVFQHIVGEDYDIIGFDPRGIGESEPHTKCFQGNLDFAAFRKNTVQESSYNLASNLSHTAAKDILLAQYREADALQRTQYALCNKTMGDKLRYMGTSTVARDIDFITTALEGKDALINYYGYSYGTVLGQYLVNMFPERVGRVVIDGVVDADTWVKKPYYKWYRPWLSSTNDAYDMFLDACYKAGSESCKLAHAQDESADAIRSRVEDFIDSLYYEPLPVPNSSNPGILASGHARVFLLGILQQPKFWSWGSQVFAEALQGDGTRMLDAARAGTPDLERSGVSCNDNIPLPPPTAEEVIDETLDVFHSVSRTVFAVITAEPDAGCQHWPVTPPERFQGPWNNTLRNPVLIWSNVADPVTPISSGRLVQSRLGDSARLVVQDSAGHCTLSSLSKCTANITQAFFATGELPKKGTVCPVDISPFPKAEDIRKLSQAEASRALLHHFTGMLVNRARHSLSLDPVLKTVQRGLSGDAVELLGQHLMVTGMYDGL